MAEIEVYTVDYEREHGHPPAGRRLWVFTLIAKTGTIISEVKSNEHLIYLVALERAKAAAELRHAFRIVVEP